MDSETKAVVLTAADIANSEHVMELQFHPLADLFPLMADPELEELAADIGKNGLREPIKIYQGKILDGRNRYLALNKIGQWTGEWNQVVDATECLSGGDEDEDEALRLVVSLNLHRRHLTGEQKREVAAKLLAMNPARSDRAIAKDIGADHKTVAAVRREAEGRGEIPHVQHRVDTKGRLQPTAAVPSIPIPAGYKIKMMTPLEHYIRKTKVDDPEHFASVAGIIGDLPERIRGNVIALMFIGVMQLSEGDQDKLFRWAAERYPQNGPANGGPIDLEELGL